MNQFQYFIYKTASNIDDGELIAGFKERKDAINYLSYVKLLDRNGGSYYMKERNTTTGDE